MNTDTPNDQPEIIRIGSRPRCGLDGVKVWSFNNKEKILFKNPSVRAEQVPFIRGKSLIFKLFDNSSFWCKLYL